MDDRLRQAPLGVVETTADGVVNDADETAAMALRCDRDRLLDTDLRETFPRSPGGSLRAAFDGDAVTPASFEEYYPEIDRWLAVDVCVDEGVSDVDSDVDGRDGSDANADGSDADGGDGTVLVYVRDRTARREAERRVERLERQSDRVEEIDTLVAAVLRRVLDASDRTEVAETVCERLGGTNLYRFA
jgi:hypothetical protein